MEKKKIAVIDIGSNSVRLMLLADGKILYKKTKITRLGEGLALTGLLQEEAMTRTFLQVEAFVQEARAERAEVYAYATAAVRSAKNGQDFVRKVKQTGVAIEVLSGEEEARVGIAGALGAKDGALLDIGGASTELILQKSNAVVYETSVDVGVVRLKDVCGRDREKLTAYCRQKAALYEGAKEEMKGLRLYAIGGTATTLAALALGLTVYDGDTVTGVALTRQEIKRLVDRLFVLSVEETSALPCVDEKRAQVLAGGALWLYEVLCYLSVDSLVVSDSDNLDGYAKTRGLM